ncbi:hypothetical protein MATL_G00086830 [Megalops atlanticus]|uniref:Uncharacterized protein n=1 Tax=Megalops atlanticus TaxID=7932 RepID=A0A9D3TE15_MEGAT|nr:hypothetical protein MATL_G00086830 [Megalops atlanticus]
MSGRRSARGAPAAGDRVRVVSAAAGEGDKPQKESGEIESRAALAPLLLSTPHRPAEALWIRMQVRLEHRLHYVVRNRGIRCISGAELRPVMAIFGPEVFTKSQACFVRQNSSQSCYTLDQITVVGVPTCPSLLFFFSKGPELPQDWACQAESTERNSAGRTPLRVQRTSKLQRRVFIRGLEEPVTDVSHVWNGALIKAPSAGAEVRGEQEGTWEDGSFCPI